LAGTPYAGSAACALAPAIDKATVLTIIALTNTM
jgi:hypothetical protein